MGFLERECDYAPSYALFALESRACTCLQFVTFTSAFLVALRSLAVENMSFNPCRREMITSSWKSRWIDSRSPL